MFNFLCSSPVTFSDKNCHADCHVQYQLEFPTSRILKTSEFLMLHFMLVMCQQFTITLEQRFQASTNRSGSCQLENNHELEIIADFIVII